jgi:hypothetical protein
LFFFKESFLESKYDFVHTIFKLDNIYPEFKYFETKLESVFGKCSEKEINNKMNINLNDNSQVEIAIIKEDLSFSTKWNFPYSIVIYHDLFSEDGSIQHYITINKDEDN